MIPNVFVDLASVRDSNLSSEKVRNFSFFLLTLAAWLGRIRVIEIEIHFQNESNPLKTKDLSRQSEGDLRFDEAVGLRDSVLEM